MGKGEAPLTPILSRFGDGYKHLNQALRAIRSSLRQASIGDLGVALSKALWGIRDSPLSRRKAE